MTLLPYELLLVHAFELVESQARKSPRAYEPRGRTLCEHAFRCLCTSRAHDVLLPPAVRASHYVHDHEKTELRVGRRNFHVCFDLKGLTDPRDPTKWATRERLVSP
jgi:hypothetical protein